MTGFTESTVEDAALGWLETAGWQVVHGPDIAPDTPSAERSSYTEVVLEPRLRDALARLNSDLPAEALEEAFRKISRVKGPDLLARNRALHRLLVDGVTIEYRDADGAIRGAQVRTLDFDDVSANDWLPVLHARLAVGAETTPASFRFETHTARDNAKTIAPTETP